MHNSVQACQRDVVLKCGIRAVTLESLRGLLFTNLVSASPVSRANCHFIIMTRCVFYFCNLINSACLLIMTIVVFILFYWPIKSLLLRIKCLFKHQDL